MGQAKAVPVCPCWPGTKSLSSIWAVLTIVMYVGNGEVRGYASHFIRSVFLCFRRQEAVRRDAEQTADGGGRVPSFRALWSHRGVYCAKRSGWK